MESCEAGRARLCDPMAEVSSHYLIGRDGQALGSFDSNVRPGSAALVATIEKALAAK